MAVATAEGQVLLPLVRVCFFYKLSCACAPCLPSARRSGKLASEACSDTHVASQVFFAHAYTRENKDNILHGITKHAHNYLERKNNILHIESHLKHKK